MLRQHGEERTAEVGELLFNIGDEHFPFIAIVEGEAVVQGESGMEIVRHGKSGFLGELSLLTGQTAYVAAVAATPLTYIAVDREKIRELLNEEGPFADLVLSTFVARRERLQTQEGIGVEVFGPRGHERTRADGETPVDLRRDKADHQARRHSRK